MLKQRLLEKLQDALPALSPEGDGAEAIVEFASLRIERPRNLEFGDYAVNVSPLAKTLRQAPPVIAEVLKASLLEQGLESTHISGFLNFRIDETWLVQTLIGLLAEKSLGQNEVMAGEAVLLEYVSANPTGPLHIGHGRWAALGDSLARIFRHCGAIVTPEFYINDAGVQMQNIGLSIYARALALLLEQGQVPASLNQLTLETPYPGDYVIEAAEAYLAEADLTKGSRRQALIQHFEALAEMLGGDLEAGETISKATIGDDVIEAALQGFARDYFKDQQRTLMETLGVHFEAWFSEKELLHQRGLVEDAIARLRNSRFIYEDAGAVWLKSSELGDEKDRVIVKSDGTYTYLAADIAYHDQKFNRQDDEGQPQYSKMMNIWGADHHGYIARMQAALVAMGHLQNPQDPKFEIVLGQLVNLIVDGERTRMGKRRQMLTLADVVEEVGVDATRFWMVFKSPDTALDFDVALAQSETSDNPVYYVQYAHARCAGILRNATQPHPNVDSGEMEPPFLTEAQLTTLKNQPEQVDYGTLFSTLETDMAKTALKELLFKLDSFEESVLDAARNRSPHFVARYAIDLSALFHGFYAHCRILTPDPTVTLPRLAVVLATQKTLAQALQLLGVSAPDRM